MGFSFQDFSHLWVVTHPLPVTTPMQTVDIPGSSTSNMAFDLMTASEDNGQSEMRAALEAAERLKQDWQMLGQAGISLTSSEQALANAFGGFNDEYYADLEAALGTLHLLDCNQHTTILYAASIRDLSKGVF